MLVQLISGLLVLAISYYGVSNVVNSPKTHRYARMRYEGFIRDLYRTEEED